MVTVIRGRRNNPQLVIKGYKYVKHHCYNGVTYFKCTYYDTDRNKCTARCTIGMDNSMRLTGHHRHAPETEYKDTTIMGQDTLLIQPDVYRYKFLTTTY